MQRGRQRGRRLLRTRAHDVSSPALHRRPLATLAATGTHVDANGSSLGAERVTAPRPTPPALQPVQNWSTNRVCRQRDRSRRFGGVTTLPLRGRSQRGPQASSETILDSPAGGTTPPYAPKTGGRLQSPPRSGGIGRAPLLPVTLRAQQATPSVTLRSLCDLPGPRASLNRHSAPCATCSAQSVIHGGWPIEGMVGGEHRKRASDQ